MYSCLSRSKSSLWASGHSEDFPAGGFVSSLGSSFLLSADTKLLPLGETELFNHTIISCIAFTSHLQWPCASITAALGLMLWVFLIYCVLTSAWARRSSTVIMDFLKKLRKKGKENEERRDQEGRNEGREKGKRSGDSVLGCWFYNSLHAG